MGNFNLEEEKKNILTGNYKDWWSIHKAFNYRGNKIRNLKCTKPQKIKLFKVLGERAEFIRKEKGFPIPKGKESFDSRAEKWIESMSGDYQKLSKRERDKTAVKRNQIALLLEEGLPITRLFSLMLYYSGKPKRKGNIKIAKNDVRKVPDYKSFQLLGAISKTFLKDHLVYDQERREWTFDFSEWYLERIDSKEILDAMVEMAEKNRGEFDKRMRPVILSNYRTKKTIGKQHVTNKEMDKRWDVLAGFNFKWTGDPFVYRTSNKKIEEIFGTNELILQGSKWEHFLTIKEIKVKAKLPKRRGRNPKKETIRSIRAHSRLSILWLLAVRHFELHIPPKRKDNHPALEQTIYNAIYFAGGESKLTYLQIAKMMRWNYVRENCFRYLKRIKEALEALKKDKLIKNYKIFKDGPDTEFQIIKFDQIKIQKEVTEELIREHIEEKKERDNWDKSLGTNYLAERLGKNKKVGSETERNFRKIEEYKQKTIEDRKKKQKNNEK